MALAKPSAFIRRVAARVAEARRGRGLTQESMAEILGTSTRALQRIEAGDQNLTLKLVARIAAVLALAPEALVAGTFDVSVRTPPPEKSAPRKPSKAR